jgi:hypothetical protein
MRDANVSRTVRAPLEIPRWTEVRSKIANCSITEQLDGNWSSFQLANSTPPQGVIDRAIAPSARTTSSQLPETSCCVFQQRCSVPYKIAVDPNARNSEIRINAPLSRQALVKGERLVRCEVSAAMLTPNLLHANC